MSEEPPSGVRIGELCRRIGITPDRLRAWERRYGLVEPQRSAGGYRLYTAADEDRVRRMHDLIGRGFAPAEAARIGAGRVDAPAEPVSTAAVLADLQNAMDRYDDVTAHDILDRLFAQEPIDTAIRDVVIPYLRQLGERWQNHELSVADEHFASAIVAGRLQGLARRWSRGAGPLAVLACPPEERHDLGLLCFGLALRSRGWRIAYLGADTPVAAIEETVEDIGPATLVLSAAIPGRFEAHLDELAVLSARTPMAIGGAGATPEVALRIGASLLRDDPVSASEQITAGVTV